MQNKEIEKRKCGEIINYEDSNTFYSIIYQSGFLYKYTVIGIKLKWSHESDNLVSYDQLFLKGFSNKSEAKEYISELQYEPFKPTDEQH